MPLDHHRIAEIRRQLLAHGSVSVAPGSFSMDRPEHAAHYTRLLPFAEAMFLVMSADTVITDSERDILRGALRTLSEGSLGTAATNAMLADLEVKLERDGADLRMDNLASHLYRDRKDRELALALAVATAGADGVIDPRESEAILELASRLGVSEERVAELLAGVPVSSPDPNQPTTD